MGLQCPRCDYQWIPRVTSPIECPRCKRHFDDAYMPGRVEVEGPEWIRQLPVVKKVVVKGATRTAYIQCAECVKRDHTRDPREPRDGKEIREAVVNVDGKSYCEEHADAVYNELKKSYTKRKPEYEKFL